MNDSEDVRLPRGDRDPDDVHTPTAETVDPGAGRDLLRREQPNVDRLLADMAAIPDTLVRAQLAQAVLGRFRDVRDEALRTLVLTYEKPVRQVSKDVGCSMSDVTMACAARRP